MYSNLDPLYFNKRIAIFSANELFSMLALSCLSTRNKQEFIFNRQNHLPNQTDRVNCS